MKTNKENKRKFVAAKKAAGFVRFEAWIKPEWRKAIKELIESLKVSV